MLRKELLFIIVYCSFSVMATCQNMTITLVDSANNSPIPYAHILYDQGITGTISNENGEFIIKYSGDSVQLRISHIAYETETINIIAYSNLTLKLQPNVALLDEVVVNARSQHYANLIFEKLRNTSQTFYGKAFYRQLSFHDTLCTEFVEAFYNVSVNRNGLEEIAVSQARFARKKQAKGDPPYLKYVNFSYLSTGFTLYVNQTEIGRPFTEDFFQKYDFFTLKKYLKSGETFVLIGFEPTNDNDGILMARGQLTYNVTRDKIVSYTMSLQHSLGLELQQANGKQNATIANPEYIWKVYFDEEHPYVNLIQMQFSYDFKQGDIITPSKVVSNFFVYQQVSKKPKKLRAPGLYVEDVAIFEKARYRPRFWKENPIIKRTAKEEKIISTFEQENAFGTYFK
jgi:hypothetical protein